MGLARWCEIICADIRASRVTCHAVFIGNENAQTRKNTSFKRRKHYMENKQNFPKKKLPTKNVDSLKELGVLDERGFFKKGKKKNFITGSMVDLKGFDYYGLPREG